MLDVANPISVPANWIVSISVFVGFTLHKIRGEKTQLNLGFLFYYYLGLLEAIVGHHLFTGCLYDMPSWASLIWIRLLVLESEFIANNIKSILISKSISPGTLTILAAYKFRKYGEFNPTFVQTPLKSRVI